jgi:hypothetical protein
MPQADRERIRRDKMIKVFEAWWDQGRPPQRKYAKALGVSTSTLSNWLWMGRGIVCYDKTHRLHKEVRESRDDAEVSTHA